MRQTGVMMGFIMQNTRPRRIVMVCCGICTGSNGSALAHVKHLDSLADCPSSPARLSWCAMASAHKMMAQRLQFKA